jgi:hypothetical protein
MFFFKILFILLQETTQRPFENDDSLEQKKQQTTEKLSATTPTGQCTGKKVAIFCTSIYGTEYEKKSSGQGISKRCRLSLLTISALVYESQCEGMGEVAGSQPMSTAVHIT